MRRLPTLAAPTSPRKAITLASSAELTYILDLQRKFSNQIGFLPRPAIEHYITHKRVALAYENGAPAGYVLGRPAFRWQPLMRPITQAAVQMDAQRRAHGLALVKRVCELARSAGQTAVQAMCRQDLDANDFWAAAGFVRIGAYDPISADRQKIICWRRALIAHPPDWFHAMPPVAGWKGRSMAKQLQLFNQTFGA